MAIGLAYGRATFEPGKISREQPAFVEALLRSHGLCGVLKEPFGYLRCSDIRATVRGPDYKEYIPFAAIEAIEDHAKCGDVTGPAARMAAEIILRPKDSFAPEVKGLLQEVARVRKRHEH